MNSERHLVANTYGTVSSNSEDIETVSNSLGGDSDDKPAAAENLVPLNISLRRAPPLYNETITTNRLPVVDRAMDQPEGATALSGEEDSMKVHDLAGYNPFNEFIIQGYENVTEEQTTIPPPDAIVPPDNGHPHPRRGTADIPVMDEVTARDALLSFVSQNLCWGLTAAESMSILDIIPSSAFHYKLETFTEKRVAAWVNEPYTGQIIDSTERGPTPKPWDVLVVPPNPIRDGQVTVEVQHSARIVKCLDCSTMGRIRCWSCFGNGESRCNACNGSGRPTNPENATYTENSRINQPPTARVCLQCNGAGQRRCVVCLGPGQLPCKKCLARGQLKISLQLTVIWRVYKSDRIVERTSIPEHLIRSVPSRVAFEEERAAVWPINFFPDEAVNHSSRELLDEHRSRFSSEKTMVQKQSVSLVPVYQIAYAWRSHRGFFYIYGYENRVFFPDYPQKSCCGLLESIPCCDYSSCNIL